VNRTDGVARVVLAGQQHFGFGFAQFPLETCEQAAQLLQGTFVFFSKFKEHAGIGNFRFKLFLPFYYAFQPAALLQKLLRGFLVGPEVRRGRLCFDCV
jgi:hypothetical protein